MNTVSTPQRCGLTAAATQFIAYKRALNRGYKTEAAALRLLERDLGQVGAEDLRNLTSVMLDSFLQSRPRNRPRSYNHLLGVVRRFFAWAIIQGLLETNPVQATLRRTTSTRRPYLFDVDEVRRLLTLARALPDWPIARHRGLVYETVFALLFALGLRVGEVSRLRLGDVDLQRAVLTIRASKFGKSRLVPFGPRVGERLQHYFERRFTVSLSPDTPMFSFTRRGHVCPETVSQTFHALWPKLGLIIPPGVDPPRLHDLRHSFAVATLLRWYREGIDPNQRLLQLSTFLGHVDPTSTAVYLTITDQLLVQANARFRTQVLPRINAGGAP